MGQLTRPDGLRQESHIRNLRAFYSYSLTFTAVAPGATATDSFNIEANSDFIWTKATYFADIAAAAQTDGTRVVPLTTLELIDTGSAYQLFSEPQPIPNVFGTGRIPFLVNPAYRFAKNATMRGVLVNFDAAATYNVRLSFIGYRDYGPVSTQV
jgi:hypothetical protein